MPRFNEKLAETDVDASLLSSIYFVEADFTLDYGRGAIDVGRKL
jgi:hypothetical protein